MFLLPELDTYGCLEKFARSPCLANLISMRFLIKRVEQRLTWDISLHAESREAVNKLLLIRAGVRGTGSRPEAHAPSMQEISEMPASDQLNYYLACCKQAGMEIDPETLVKLGQTG